MGEELLFIGYIHQKDCQIRIGIATLVFQTIIDECKSPSDQ